MKRTIITTFALLILTAPLAWGGGSSSDNCREQGQPEQSVTGSAPQPAEQAAPKARTRGMSISDFVTDERSVEKSDGGGSNGRAPAQPQEQPRTLEKKCSNDNC